MEIWRWGPLTTVVSVKWIGRSNLANASHTSQGLRQRPFSRGACGDWMPMASGSLPSACIWAEQGEVRRAGLVIVVNETSPGRHRRPFSPLPSPTPKTVSTTCTGPSRLIQRLSPLAGRIRRSAGHFVDDIPVMDGVLVAFDQIGHAGLEQRDGFVGVGRCPSRPTPDDRTNGCPFRTIP